VERRRPRLRLMILLGPFFMYSKYKTYHLFNMPHVVGLISS
jgi:hypothetical protein